ncbi:MAG: restriction endonuclease subunit S [Actinomycetota bacterium]|jgi:type I restriction enzyme S subunit|nr:restriction endonuclease subunit S [Actinomycetota bacterium]MDA8263993.1 restriction endonuclease subunit S [Actinomycetota bacterium]
MNVLPKGWVDTTLGEVCRVEYGKGLSANQRTESGAVPVVGSAGVIGRHSVSLVPGPVIVIGRKGNAGAIHLLRDACWPIDTTYFVRVPPPFDPAFLAYQLRDAQLRSLDSSTAVPSLRRPDLEACPLLVAPIREQQRIVAVIEEQFSRLDAGSSALTSAERRVNHLKAAAMVRALSGDWPLKSLSDVTEDQTYGSSAKATDDHEDGMPIVRMGNIQGGQVDLSAGVKFLPRDDPDASKFALRRGDLLFNRTNSPELVGKSAVYSGEDGAACFASYLIRVRLTDACDPRWVALYLNSPAGRRWAASVRTQQVGQANINGTKLAALPLPLPPVEEQARRLHEYERQTTIAQSLSRSIESALARSNALRRAIFARAFSGRLVSQDPPDEPAPELLARITSARADAPKLRQRQRA